MSKRVCSVLRSTLLCGIFVAAVSVLAALPAQATAPGRNGAIVFQHFGHYLWVINSDGRGARQLTDFKGAEDANPDWSPDGSMIAFDRCSSHCEIWTVKSDGTASRRLGPNCLHRTGACTDRAVPAWDLNAGDRPDWSPDGKLILFRAVSTRKEQHGNLYTIHPDGTALKQLTSYPEPKAVSSGSFSPDGKWITFSRFTTSSYPDIFVMRTNGTDVRQVSRKGVDYQPDWGSAQRH